MRIWSLHPSLLDKKGLVACWRETLLAKHVLEGKTKGYKNHPQLQRFKQCRDPLATINAYLGTLYIESKKRGYNFDVNKIDFDLVARQNEMLPVTDSQVEFEMAHLKRKCATRDVKWIEVLDKGSEVNSMFRVVSGPIEPWEKL